MKNVQIAAVVPIGPIKRLGYQYFVSMTLKNMTEYFNHIYVISNTKEVTELPIKSKKIVFISDENSYLDRDNKNNSEKFFLQSELNVERLKCHASKNEDHVLLLADILQYIDKENYNRLCKYCKYLLKKNKPWGYKYRALQVFNKIAYPDIRHPWIVNLTHKDVDLMKYMADSIDYKGTVIRCERGCFKNAPYYFTDIFPPVVTEEDFNDKYEYYLKLVWNYYNSGYKKDWEAFDQMNYKKALSKVYNPNAKLSELGRMAIDNLPKNSSIFDWDLTGLHYERKYSFRQFLNSQYKIIKEKLIK